MSVVPVSPLRLVKRRNLAAGSAVASGFGRRKPAVAAGSTGRPVALQTATAAHAGAIHALIVEHLAGGHLLPRELGEIAVHAGRFVVALQDDRVVACAELAPLSRSVAEVRSLVVGRDARSAGLGRRIVDELMHRAEAAGFEKLCAFTHTPAYFVHMGFSIVPHVWLPEKVVTDCHSCCHFRQCGQYAVLRALGRIRQSCVPLAALHG
jgi:N-acetylglutamate synthase-like GNAT family acetyltransferase